MQIGAIRFRLWQMDHSHRSESAFHIPHDHHALLRAEASWLYLKALRSPPHDRTSNPFAPTAYQRRRLVLLIAISDARSDGVSTREIAFALVFPRTRPLTGATWKGANEKRQTLRLIREAKSRIAGGYLRLPGFGPVPSLG